MVPRSGVAAEEVYPATTQSGPIEGLETRSAGDGGAGGAEG